MIPAPFDYLRPRSVEEALALLGEHGPDARVLAGGHSLLPQMKLRRVTPRVLIDVGELAELRGIREEDGRVLIGALTTHAEIEHSEVLKRRVPLLPRAARVVSDPLIRNRGTLGGALVEADPAGDWPAVALALDATLHLVGPAGPRALPIGDFLSRPGGTALRSPELLRAVELPFQVGNDRATYLKRMHPASGYALVGVAARVRLNALGQCEDCRIAVTGAGEVPARSLESEHGLLGQVLTREGVEVAAALAPRSLKLVGDRFASAGFRAHLVSVYVRRSLEMLMRG